MTISTPLDNIERVNPYDLSEMPEGLFLNVLVNDNGLTFDDYTYIASGEDVGAFECKSQMELWDKLNDFTFAEIMDRYNIPKMTDDDVKAFKSWGFIEESPQEWVTKEFFSYLEYLQDQELFIASNGTVKLLKSLRDFPTLDDFKDLSDLMIPVYWDYTLEGEDTAEVTLYPTKEQPHFREYKFSKRELNDYLLELSDYVERDTDDEIEDSEEWEKQIWDRLISSNRLSEFVCEMINSGNGDFQPLMSTIWVRMEEAAGES